MLLNILCVGLNKQYHADHLYHKAIDINKIRNETKLYTLYFQLIFIVSVQQVV